MCLDDGFLLVDGGVEARESGPKEAEGMTKRTYWMISFWAAVGIGLFVFKFRGNPFERFSLLTSPGADMIEAVMFNMGVFTGLFLMGMMIALPIWAARRPGSKEAEKREIRTFVRIR